jgi:hypothetical protein
MPRRTTNARPRRQPRRLRRLDREPTTYVRLCTDCGHVETSSDPRFLDWRECPRCELLAARAWLQLAA